MKRHVVTQPAFDPTPLVIIAASALHSVLITALKSIDIELAHIVPDPFKALDQLAISHALHLLFTRLYHFRLSHVQKNGQLLRVPQELFVCGNVQPTVTDTLFPLKATPYL